MNSHKQMLATPRTGAVVGILKTVEGLIKLVSNFLLRFVTTE